MSHPDNLTGVLVVDKPAGRSSMSVVAAVRRRAGRARTGHAGTLDPLATGVLVLALGLATKIVDRLMATDKRDRTVIDLSAFTPTDDREGALEPVSVERPPELEHIRHAVRQFVGSIRQQPPPYSAVKVDGRRAYKLARRGMPAELPARSVRIDRIDVIAYEWPRVELDVRCGKGVYIRRLARDLGSTLGTGGYCLSIRRTAVGPFAIEDAVALEDVPDPITPADLISVEQALEMVSPPSPPSPRVAGPDDGSGASSP